MTYYITSSEYVGPNLSDRCNSHSYEIKTKAPRTNSSREIRTEGWLGTTNDVAEYAHGEFETLEEARAAVLEILGTDYRETDLSEMPEYERGGLIESYTVGAYLEVDAETSITWCYESIRSDVTADTTDAGIDALIDEYEVSANESDEPFTLDVCALQTEMRERRDELIAERDEK